MENASKALIIAGAILISIIIIGLGVYFVNMAQSAGKKVNLNSQAAQAQNSQFTAYFGDKVQASEVKSLMSLIRTNNITGKTGDETNYICVVYGGKVSTPSDISRTVIPGKTYKVWELNDNASDIDVSTLAKDAAEPADGYYTSGFLKTISVTQN